MSATPPHWLAVPPPTPELAEEPPTSNVTTNAADIYRHAFAAYDALTDEEKKLLGDWKTPMDPLVAAALCQKLQLMREWLHQAASVTNCDWGLGPITPETPLPHLLAARALARAMVWSAAHCRVHDPTGTTADLWATLRLGQQVSSPGLIGHLVQTAMEGMVLDYIAANVGALRGGPAAQLLQALGDPQYEESYYRAMEDEAKIIRRLADQVAALSPEEAQAYLRSMLAGGENATGQEWGQAVAGLRLAADWVEDYTRALQLPEAKYQDWLAQWRALRQENPFVGLVAPALDRILDRTRSAVVQRALVVAGLAVVQNGPGALTLYSDPATGQPFIYRATDSGFELQSAYLYRDRPVSMLFRAF